jgi:hypothetical protein
MSKGSSKRSITSLARIYIGGINNENRGQSFQPRGRPRIMLNQYVVHSLQDDPRFEDLEHPDQHDAWTRSVYRYFRACRRINVEAQDRGWVYCPRRKRYRLP